MAFTVNMAGKIINIDNIHPESEDFCKDYIIENTSPDFSIVIHPDDILYEEKYANEQSFSSSYLETLAVLRKISDILPKFHRFLIHGACISYKNNAYLFTAPSGTGKSTHIRLWRKYLGEDVQIVNGDKPFISLDSSQSDGTLDPRIYGTPWAGKERWQRNCNESLKGICFLQRGTTNTIRRIEPSECLIMLMNQVYIPEDAEMAGKTLELIDCLVKHVPLYLLSCDISEEAVRCSFEALTGLHYPL